MTMFIGFHHCGGFHIPVSYAEDKKETILVNEKERQMHNHKCTSP